MTREQAYKAGLRALAEHSDTYDTLRHLVEVVVDAAAPEMGAAVPTPMLGAADIKRLRDRFLDAMIAQARWEAANGKGAEKGFYDGEISRAADWMETLR